MYSCRGQRSTADVFFNCSPADFFEIRSLIESEVQIQLAVHLVSKSMGLPILVSPELTLQIFYMGAENQTQFLKPTPQVLNCLRYLPSSIMSGLFRSLNNN